MVRSIKALRDAGCPLQTIRKAQTLIEHVWQERLSELVLYWDGSDILAAEKWGTLRSAVTHPGQQVLHLVALPVSRWCVEVERAAEIIDLSDRREAARAARRAGSRRTPTKSIRTETGNDGVLGLS